MILHQRKQSEGSARLPRAARLSLGAAPVAVALVLGGSVAPAAAAEVSIPDAALAACINAALGQNATDPIEDTQAETIDSLFCDDGGITDLTGISALTILRSLDISSSSIDDLSELASLNSLDSLSFIETSVGDVSVLAETALTGLTVAGGGVTDVTAFGELTELRYLNLDNNQITDVAPLAALESLEFLRLVGNQISDISPLLPFIEIFNERENNAIYRIDVWDQRVELPAVVVGDVQSNPVRGVEGDLVPVTLTAGSGSVAADGLSWTFDAPGTNTLAWDETVLPDDSDERWSIRFSGQVTQESLADVTPTVLADDVVSTPVDVSVEVEPLANDATEPAVDSSSLRLVDASGAAVDEVTVTEGVFTRNGTTITFVPNAGYSGTVTPVTYQVTNVNGIVSQAAIRVTVTAADTGGTTDPGDTGSASTESAGDTGSSTGSASLAATGSEPPVNLLGIGLIALLLGAALIPLSRLRRTH